MNLSPKFYFTGGVDGGRGWKGDVKLMRLNTEKAEQNGWKPKMNSYEAVERAVDELLKN
jgi:UDP-glucose 4-epimerase